MEEPARGQLQFKQSFLKKTIPERQLVIAKIERTMERTMPKKLYGHTTAYQRLAGLLEIAYENRNKQANMLGDQAFSKVENQMMEGNLIGFGNIKGRIVGYDSKDDSLVITVTSIEDGKALKREDLSDTTYITKKSKKHKKGFLYIPQQMVI